MIQHQQHLPTGSYWTDAAGNPIRSGDGGYVYTGSATKTDIAAGTVNPPSAPAPAPETSSNYRLTTHPLQHLTGAVVVGR